MLILAKIRCRSSEVSSHSHVIRVNSRSNGSIFMHVRDLLENLGGKGSETSTVELTSEDDSVEIEVEFMFDVEPTEYEGGYVSSQGGVDLEDTKIQPFSFEKKRYTDRKSTRLNSSHANISYAVFCLKK